VDNDQEKSDEGPDRRPRHYSTSRLLREKIPVRDGDMLSTVRHRGQIMVRLESPADDRALGD
jgi:hypothetical protein